MLNYHTGRKDGFISSIRLLYHSSTDHCNTLKWDIVYATGNVPHNTHVCQPQKEYFILLISYFMYNAVCIIAPLEYFQNITNQKQNYIENSMWLNRATYK